jgi:hypothetical protein
MFTHPRGGSRQNVGIYTPLLGRNKLFNLPKIFLQEMLYEKREKMQT